MLNDALISQQLAIAPNPLGRTPNLRLKTIPIDAYSCFELWAAHPDAILLPEEAALLQGDRDRLEEICTTLTWLIGTTCYHTLENWIGETTHTWQDVLRLLDRHGFEPDAIEVKYLPQTVCPVYSPNQSLTGWTIHPCRWEILFLEFQPMKAGFQVEPVPLSWIISIGKPTTRLIKNVVLQA